jgi:hypothetical protein
LKEGAESGERGNKASIVPSLLDETLDKQDCRHRDRRPGITTEVAFLSGRRHDRDRRQWWW